MAKNDYEVIKVEILKTDKQKIKEAAKGEGKTVAGYLRPFLKKAIK